MCEAFGYDNIIVSSGVDILQFMDDMHYPFRANVLFKEWLPLDQRAGAYLRIPSSGRPELLLDCTEDIWHTPPQQLPDGWDSPFEISEFTSTVALIEQLKTAMRPVYLGPDNPLELPATSCNPERLCQSIAFQRRFKTDYEHACIGRANALAAAAHLVARDTFLARGSELDIKLAYLGACGQAEVDMPYSIIAGLNEHAAVLHHYRLDTSPPDEHRSFLLDAGVSVFGYASDITRSWAFEQNSEYAELVARMDAKQLELCAAVRPGISGIDLHLSSHQKIAEVLVEFGLVNCSAEACVESDLTSYFYPHGIGHGLGVNVHELGGRLANAEGEEIPPPQQYPALRNTCPWEAGSVNTVEPGLYFIPSLLEKLRAAPQSADVVWPKVDSLQPYGGVRIEDNMLLTKDGEAINLTRQAFAAM